MVTAIILVLTSLLTGSALAQSAAGMVLEAQAQTSLTIPAGQTAIRLDEVYGTVPPDAFSTQSQVTRAVVYVTAGGSDTTCQVGLSGESIFTPPISVPAGTTVTIPFEDTGPAAAGQVLLEGIAITAGSGGPLTFDSGSSLTVLVLPTEGSIY